VEQIGGRRREHLDPEIVVQEDRGDLRAFQQVLEIGVGVAELLDALAELA